MADANLVGMRRVNLPLSLTRVGDNLGKVS